ncbi:M1 family metallopeptidase [Mechercharimyces sp. CAU 1602]|uniref:M1 family metallopeptidase n=1 Tax=Mechercharimyces sp. CAU 1602 TaxID=2973933 RepID=UPI0021619917|nr:M1 family metallopeptidase [Mechercharimyces sp. CAU 1602]MCS1350493.1 M1 family metallopeptidase [Mechercharimyces sp. CAU 1602]
MKRAFSWVLVITFLLSVCVASSTVEAVTYQDSGVDRPTYVITADYDENEDRVRGHYSLTLPQRFQKEKELYFHLYPNAFRDWKWGSDAKPKKAGYLKVSTVKVNGKKVKTEEKGTLLKVINESTKALPQVKVEMEYELKIPQGGTRLNTVDGTAFLAQWYPMLAVKDKQGWHTDEYTTTGDPFFSEISDFAVTFTLPKGYSVITTANDRSAENPRNKVKVKQERVRDFAAMISKDYEVITGKSGQTEVNLWYLKGMEHVSQTLHDTAVCSMDYFSQTFGTYPYEEVDVILGETGLGIAGMEYPGLVTSIPELPTKDGKKAAHSVVAHELAHQWWYGVVGNDQVHEPWLDEGITTFSEFLFMKEKMNEDERQLLQRAAERTEDIHDKIGITSVEPVDKYPDPIYGLMVYIRPAAMMWSLADEIGMKKVKKILHTYYDQYQFKTASTEDFIRVASEVAGKDLNAFFAEWLYFEEQGV